mmetsp:Transcript_29631/g.61509  ORF Transcript_29631/g.61509 Transcript_29631/m.61509 type:complete len:246 (+) Transcript_29631:193-930(+)
MYSRTYHKTREKIRYLFYKSSCQFVVTFQESQYQLPIMMMTAVARNTSAIASFAVLLIPFLINIGVPAQCWAFLAPSAPIRSHGSLLSTSAGGDPSIIDNLTKGYESFQNARGEGYDVKQSIAIAIAGDYDADAVKAKINECINSAPCVMFTWEASPACKKAIKYLDIAGASYKNVRIDDPWSEGNPIRAELGKMVGRSSVPCIFIGGKYVGGFDAGVGDESPGLLDMAFKGTLREKLKEVGALE